MPPLHSPEVPHNQSPSLAGSPIRNRYLALYKVMSAGEFVVAGALLTVGAPLNALEFGLSPTRRVLYGLALAPVALLALVTTLLSLPRYRAKRRAVLAQRAGGRAVVPAGALAGGRGQATGLAGASGAAGS